MYIDTHTHTYTRKTHHSLSVSQQEIAGRAIQAHRDGRLDSCCQWSRAFLNWRREETRQAVGNDIYM